MVGEDIRLILTEKEKGRHPDWQGVCRFFEVLMSCREQWESNLRKRIPGNMLGKCRRTRRGHAVFKEMDDETSGGYIAVSYTHLDVYKRQGIYCLQLRLVEVKVEESKRKGKKKG